MIIIDVYLHRKSIDLIVMSQRDDFIFSYGLSYSNNLTQNRQICFTDYKALQFCVYVPGCLFSTACVNILGLNLFPKYVSKLVSVSSSSPT